MESSQRETLRFDYVDIAKAIGMLAVIWGHIMQAGVSHNIVYGFHIPLFFFLSGLMFQPGKYPTFKLFLRKRIRTLLLPYLLYSSATWIIWIGLSLLGHAQLPTGAFYSLAQTFIAQGSAGYIMHDVPLWFITCLFMVELVYFYVSKLPKMGILLLCVVCAGFGSLMIQDGSTLRHLPWNMDVVFCALIFYAFGHFVSSRYNHAEIVDRVTRKKNFAIVFFIAVTSALILILGAIYNGSVSMGSRNMGNSALCFYLTSFSGIVAVMLMSILFSQWNFSFLKCFGRFSFDAMAIHYPIQTRIKGMVARIFPETTENGWIFTLPACIGMFVITLLLTCIIMYCVQKLRKIITKRKLSSCVQA